MTTPQLKFWQIPNLGNLELLHASHLTHDYPRHMHEEHSVALVLNGKETTTCSTIQHVATRGNLILINAEQVHSNLSMGAEYRLMKIRPGVLSRIALEMGRRRLDTVCFPNVVVNDSVLFRSLLKLHLKLEQNSSTLEQESEFISAMALLVTRQTESAIQPFERVGKEDRYVALVRDYLRSHYAENVALSQLSALTNLSPYYLLRVFHSQVGFPPHEYQTQVRVAHARKLIRRGNSISRAAQETGFFDQSHLSRNFKRISGMTPRQYLSQSKPLRPSPN